MKSNVSYDNFKHLLAEFMDISVKRLNVGYTLSTWRANDPPSVLSKVSHLVGLFDAVAKEKDRLDKAKRKGNNTKDLFVMIKDLNDVKGTKAKGVGKKSKVSPSAS